jgi:hypothetical protein
MMANNRKHVALTEQHKNDEKNERIGTTNAIALDGEVTNQEKSKMIPKDDANMKHMVDEVEDV